MKWYLDTHKFISEIPRDALQVLVKYGLTAESSQEEIERAENELGDIGIYKNREAAKGRIRRALFTYFKAYDCLDDNEQLTTLGKLFAENKLSVREFCFVYILNFYYKTDEAGCYPVHVLLTTLKKLQVRNASDAYITPNDFALITDCDSADAVTDEFIEKLALCREKVPEQVDEREIGFDVWSNMLVKAGILVKNKKRLFASDWELIDWILSAYKDYPIAKRGELITGVIKHLPVPNDLKPYGDLETVKKEKLSVQAYLFDAVNDYTIDKYIATSHMDIIKKALGLNESHRGYYKPFIGLERLVGYFLTCNEQPALHTIGELLTDVDISEFGRKAVKHHTGISIAYERNRIIFGAPGTGKSHYLEKDRKVVLQNDEIGAYERVTFHPDYTYSQFVGAYKPVTDNDGKIRYEFVPGPFMRLYVKALRNGNTDIPEPHVLIIEEINRADVAAVFGDVFQLLDRGINNVSEYPIQATEDIKGYLAKELGGSPEDYSEILIPDNMLIWATMNSADQGVFPMDTAFKRRWDFMYLGINNGEEKIRGKKVLLGKGEHEKEIEWNELRKAINNVLLNDCKVNEDKLMGPFFIAMKDLPEGNVIDPKKFKRIFKNKVLMYLFDDAAKQKRPTLFDGCTVKNLYSAICDEFEDKGVDIFGNTVRSKFPRIKPEENQE